MAKRCSADVAGCCKPRSLKARPPMSPSQAGGLASVFKVLANDARLQILYALVRADELCVTELANEVGMKPQVVSNELQRLCNLGIIQSRRAGVNVHYRVMDLRVQCLLDRGLCLTEESTSRNLERCS